MAPGGTIEQLRASAKAALEADRPLPFSLYTSCTEQRILNAPILKPLLICVLAGVKHLGRDGAIVCPAGRFVFLSNSPTIDMRNIPDHDEYCALLVDFEYGDFHQFPRGAGPGIPHLQGDMDMVLTASLRQFAEWSAYAPPAAWHFRKKELLQLLYQAGHHGVASLATPPSFSHQVCDLVGADIAADWSAKRLTAALAVSETTLRRNQKAEGTDMHAHVNRISLGHALHLLQTTMEPVGLIADRCGYYSQSRFTEKFRRLFGVTPGALRKTRVRPDGKSAG